MRNHDEVLKQIEPFPKLPRTTIDESTFVPPDNLAPDEVKLLSSIEITIEKAHQLFCTTMRQSIISEWYEARKKKTYSIKLWFGTPSQKKCQLRHSSETFLTQKICPM